MQKPSTVALDANVCLVHALNLGVHFNVPVYDCDCRPVRCFVNGCQKESIRIGTYQKTKNHTYDNLAERVDEVARKCHMREWYAMSSLYAIGEKNLDHLFLVLTIFPDNWTPKEILDAEAFFQRYGNNVGTYTNPQKPKVPEPHDLEFLVSSHNLGPGMTHIVSDDSHFTKNAKEIQDAGYNVIVIPMKRLKALTMTWGWN